MSTRYATSRPRDIATLNISVLVSNCWTEKMWGICGEKSTFSPHICNILAIKCPPQHFIKKFPTNSPSIPFKSSNSLHFTHGQINILSMGPHFINILSYAQLASCQNGWCGEYAGKMLILVIWLQTLHYHSSWVGRMWGICRHGHNVEKVLILENIVGQPNLTSILIWLYSWAYRGKDQLDSEEVLAQRVGSA